VSKPSEVALRKHFSKQCKRAVHAVLVNLGPREQNTWCEREDSCLADEQQAHFNASDDHLSSRAESNGKQCATAKKNSQI